MTVVELFELGGVFAWLGLAVVIAILFAINRKYKKNTAPSTPDNNQAASVVNITAPAAGAVLAEGEVIAAISAAVAQYRKNNNA